MAEEGRSHRNLRRVGPPPYGATPSLRKSHPIPLQRELSSTCYAPERNERHDHRRAPGSCETVNRNFDAAAAFTSYPPGLLEQIKICNSVYRFDFPAPASRRRLEVIHAWRAEHSHHKLPVKGGIRYAPTSTKKRSWRSPR